MRLSTKLTYDVDKWDPNDVDPARKLYFEATERLNAIPEYRHFLQAQILSKITETFVAAAKAEPGGHQAVLKFIEPYLKNKAFGAEVAKVEEVRNAVLSTLKPEEQNKVAKGEEVRNAVLSTLKPEERTQVLATAQPEEIAKAVSGMSAEDIAKLKQLLENVEKPQQSGDTNTSKQ